MINNLPAMWEDPGLIPGSRRFPGEGNVYPIQYSCLDNPTDRGTWWAKAHGVTESDTAEQLQLSLHFSHAMPISGPSSFQNPHHSQIQSDQDTTGRQKSISSAVFIPVGQSLLFMLAIQPQLSSHQKLMT